MAFAAGLMIFGTGSTVSKKLLFSVEAPTPDGESRKFNKPWFQADLMFFAMMMVLVFHHVQEYFAKRTKDPEKQRLLAKGLGPAATEPQEADANQQTAPTWKVYLYVMVPACFDLLQTVMCNIALTWVAASIWQMLRGSMVIFSAGLSIIFLQRKFYCYNWVGLALVVTALILVGIACLSAAPAPGSPTDPRYQIFGIGLVILGQFVAAAQMVVEEFLLKEIKAPPTLIIGLEGLWGFILTSFVCLPLFQHLNLKGFSENSVETLYMLQHSDSVVWICVVYCVVVTGYNHCAMSVTKQYTAVHRTIVEAMRTALVWLVNIFIYYKVDMRFGEKWSKWSYLQLLGFVILMFGMSVYNQVIPLPWLSDLGPQKSASLTTVLRRQSPKPDSRKFKLKSAQTPPPEVQDFEEENHLALPPLSPYSGGVMKSPKI